MNSTNSLRPTAFYASLFWLCIGSFLLAPQATMGQAGMGFEYPLQRQMSEQTTFMGSPGLEQQNPIAHQRMASLPEYSPTAPSRSSSNLSTKFYCGVDQSWGPSGRESTWHDSQMIPWENYAFGEYIGPPRTPHVPEYRLRVDDQLEFIFQASRKQSFSEYQLAVGDRIRVVSSVDPRLNQATVENGIGILGDGTISLDLIGSVVAAGKTLEALNREREERYSRYFDTPPKINVSGIQTDTKRQDFLDSVDARAGAGGQARFARVTADGTLRLPLIGAVGVVGLTLDELEREVNARYSQNVKGIQVSVVLAQQAPRFLYVVGEVERAGRIELVGPTSVMQAIALAGGWRNGGNLRQVVVFRRDQNWRLMALKLDLAGGLLGKRPAPSDEIWLRDSDIILVPKSPILRLADAIDLYFSRSIYGIFPSQLGVFDAQSVNAQ